MSEHQIRAQEADEIKAAVMASGRSPNQSHAEFAAALIAAFEVVDAAMAQTQPFPAPESTPV